MKDFKFRDFFLKTRIENSFYILMTSFGWLPVTIFWLLLIPENAVDFRRLISASVIFWVIPIVYLDNKLKTVVTAKYNKCTVVSLLFFLGFMWGLNLRASTVSPQIDSWSAAICASEVSRLNQYSQLDPNIISAVIDERYQTYNDEYAVDSLVFPGPQTFIPWLANKYSGNGNEIVQAWGMGFSTKKMTREGRLWSKKYLLCLSR